MTTIIQSYFKKKTRTRFLFFLVSGLIVLFFFVLIEGLFHESKVSLFSSLNLSKKSMVLLQVYSLFSIVFLIGSLLGGGVLVLIGLIFRSELKLISTIPLLCPFAIFGILNYFYIDRWIYSVFEYNMVSRPFWINIIFLICGVLLGLLIFKFNTLNLLEFVEKKERLVVFILGVILIAPFFLTYSKISDSKRMFEYRSLVSDITPARKPNIIILTYDMFETSHTPLTGYFRNTTPNLLNRKDEFFIFSNAIAVAVESRAGTCAIFTGKPPVSTGVYEYPDRLSGVDAFLHLPGILKAAGYYTVNYGYEKYTNPIMYNMLDGFSNVNGRKIVNTQLPLSTVKWNRIQYAFFDELSFISAVLDDLLMNLEYTFRISDRLKQRKDKALVTFKNRKFPYVLNRIGSLAKKGNPFFMHYHSTVTHNPVVYRKFKRFSNLDDRCTKQRKKYQDCNGKSLTQDQILELYDDAVLHLDYEVEQIIKKLEKYNQYDNTILVLTTDHEYGWGMNGHPVALMIHLPYQKSGGTVHSRAWMLDIAPTLIDYIEAGHLSWMEGVSLLPLMNNAPSRSQLEQYLQKRVVHIDKRKKGNRKITALMGDLKIQINQAKDSIKIFDISHGVKQQKKIKKINTPTQKKMLEKVLKILDRPGLI